MVFRCFGDEKAVVRSRKESRDEQPFAPRAPISEGPSGRSSPAETAKKNGVRELREQTNVRGLLEPELKDSRSSEQRSAPRALSAVSTASASLRVSRNEGASNAIPESIDKLTTLVKPEDLLAGITGLEFVGCGFFAKVFKGYWMSSKVAVKLMVVPPNSNSKPWRELMCKDLAHPNVVQTFTTRRAIIDAEYLEKHLGKKAGGKREGASGNGAPQESGTESSINQSLNQSSTFVSGDGFGDPMATKKETQNSQMLPKIIEMLGVQPGNVMDVIVMDYVDGGTLLTLLLQGIFVPKGDPSSDRHRFRALLRTISDVAKGLKYLHSRDILHGDLKPPNVLIKSSRKDRRGFVAQICDFGLSRCVEGSKDLAITAPTGSFAYMAPEVLQSCTSKAADVYALGIMIHEMQFGERPYKGKTVPEVVLGVSQGTLRPVWGTLPNGSSHPELKQLYHRCVDMDPLKRPTATEIVKELCEIEDRLRRAMKGEQQVGNQQTTVSYSSETSSAGP